MVDPNKHILFALNQAKLNLERALVIAEAGATTKTVDGEYVAPVALLLNILEMLTARVKEKRRPIKGN